MIKTKKIANSYPPSKAIQVKDLKSARRLLSKLIYDLQTGKIKSQTAKDLTYLLTCYVNVFKQYEIEQRVEQLEERLMDEPLKQKN